jgi:hypothetical protein
MGRSLAALAALALLTAPTARADTIRLGKGLGPWRIGITYRAAPGLMHIERYPKNDGPGCVGGPDLAARIDYYENDIRLVWNRAFNGKLVLLGVATAHIGDRSGDGFVIGKSRMRHVLRAHPAARISRKPNKFNLGYVSATLYRRTGDETGRYFTYWFHRTGLLVALETGESGC